MKPKKTDRIEIFRSRKNGEFSWRYRRPNNERIAIAGETYKQRLHASAMIHLLFGEKITSGAAVVVDLTKTKA